MASALLGRSNNSMEFVTVGPGGGFCLLKMEPIIRNMSSNNAQWKQLLATWLQCHLDASSLIQSMMNCKNKLTFEAVKGSYGARTEVMVKWSQ